VKAKTLSLIAKGVAVAMLVGTWIFKVVLDGGTALDALLLAAGVLAVFGDVSLNIFFDKIAAIKGGKAE
jgi:predicted membrane-bound spermidine synthase